MVTLLILKILHINFIHITSALILAIVNPTNLIRFVDDTLASITQSLIEKPLRNMKLTCIM